jgi:hypothetical protein
MLRRIAIIIVGIFLTEGISAIAATLCTPPLCPMQVKVSWCHRAMDTQAESASRSLVLGGVVFQCCQISPSPLRPPGEVLPKLSVETFNRQPVRQIAELTLIATEFSFSLKPPWVSTLTFCLDRSDTYLDSRILRI